MSNKYDELHDENSARGPDLGDKRYLDAGMAMNNNIEMIGGQNASQQRYSQRVGDFKGLKSDIDKIDVVKMR